MFSAKVRPLCFYSYYCRNVSILAQMSVRHNLANFSALLPPTVNLVAVSKNQPVSDILEAYQCGQRRFGENKVQELLNKQPQLPEDIEWHFIGHLQTNKVKYIVPFISMIESIDSLKLLNEINGEAAKIKRVVDCLLEMFIATEESKFGLDLEEAKALFDSGEYRAMSNIRIRGLMGMATFTDDENRVRKEFQSLHHHFQLLKKEYFPDDPRFSELSMGMSDDYMIAVEEGSTIVRIGTALFGERKYRSF